MYNIDTHSKEVTLIHWFYTIEGVNILQSDLHSYCCDVRDYAYYNQSYLVDIPASIDQWLCNHDVITPCYSGQERSAGSGIDKFISWMEST